ncbi:MAG: GntR family transcriptional regulator [Planctomycetota bacterium]
MSDSVPTRQSLSDQVAALLRDEILQGMSAGEKLPPEPPLAERFGVSIGTVRAGLATLVTEGLLERRQGSGTYVTDLSARRHVALSIGVDIADPELSYFFRRIFQKVREFFFERDITCHEYVFRFSDHDTYRLRGICDSLIDDIEQGLVSCLVTLAVPGYDQLRERLAPKAVPWVALGGLTHRHRVDLDHVDMLNQGLACLGEMGCKRLGVFDWGTELRDRELRQAVDVPEDDPWFDFRVPACLQPGAAFKTFCSLWNSRSDRPDGLLICEDTIYREVVSAVLKLGIRVPDDLVLVATENKGAKIHYPVPTIRMTFDPDTVARELGHMAVGMMDGDESGNHCVFVPFEWTGRDEVGRLRRSAGADKERLAR